MREPTALGMPPMPSWRQAPSGISGTICRATARSTGPGTGAGSWAMGGSSPSTTQSTRSMCTPVPWPPRQTGMFRLTSTTILSATSHRAARWEVLGPKLKKPCPSMGATWNMATSTWRMFSR